MVLYCKNLKISTEIFENQILFQTVKYFLMIKHLPPFIFFLIFLFSATHAAVLVVSNIPGSGQKYSSIQSAVEHASPNDTIFVMGSPTNYGNVLLEKPLTLIAEGFLEESPTGHTAKLTRVLLTSNKIDPPL